MYNTRRNILCVRMYMIMRDLLLGAHRESYRTIETKKPALYIGYLYSCIGVGESKARSLKGECIEKTKYKHYGVLDITGSYWNFFARS